MGDGDDAAGLTIGITGTAVARQSHGAWSTAHSFGQIVDLLARRVGRVEYHAPLAFDVSACDYSLSADNIHVTPWFRRRNTAHALRHPIRLLRDYAALVRSSDVLFLRGSAPLIWTAHVQARRRGRRVVHWIVGNPPEILRGADRGYGGAGRHAGLVFARFEQAMTRWAARVSHAEVLANGEEIARIFSSARTRTVVSTSITDADFRRRADTCDGASIRLLFFGFIRPEKGIEYLFRAIPLVQTSRAVHLTLVGSWAQFPGERQRLCGVLRELGIEDRVTWAGHCPFGPRRFDAMDESDILILPTLSEGTPRVLVEARARCLPVVATRVGGIPTSVGDGVDGLLVEPRDPVALARAISRIIDDAALRARMIRAGYDRARTMTVDRFVDGILALLRTGDP